MQSLALSGSLHVCVRGFLTAYDKSFSQWLWQQQQRKQHKQPINGYRRQRARDSVGGYEFEWRLLLFFGHSDRSASISFSPAVSKRDDVFSAAAQRRAIRSTKKGSIASEGEGAGPGAGAGEGVSGGWG